MHRVLELCSRLPARARLLFNRLTSPSAASGLGRARRERTLPVWSLRCMELTACRLLQMHGLTILTDPVMGEQPVKTMFAPKRMRPLPCQPEVLRGRVDVVLLSHK